jgi:signal peptidase I
MYLMEKKKDKGHEKGKTSFKKILKKVWYFIWEDNSVWSWLVNIILAVVLIKFVIYPGLGLALGTQYPVVAVVSGSMEHDGNFDYFWDLHGTFYLPYNITKEGFSKFKFKNGFNTGDIMVLRKADPTKLKVGDTIVFKSNKPDPIIHRVIAKWQENGVYYFRTKGDHNSDINYNVLEDKISQDRLIGRAAFRIPYLGYVKIWFVEFLKLIHVTK